MSPATATGAVETVVVAAVEVVVRVVVDPVVVVVVVAPDEAAAQVGGPADARQQHEGEQHERPEPAAARPVRGRAGFGGRWAPSSHANENSPAGASSRSGVSLAARRRALQCGPHLRGRGIGDLERGCDERHLGGVGAVVARQREQLLLERDPHLAHVVVAIVAALGEGLRDDRGDAVRRLRAARLHVRHGSAQVLLGDLDERRAAIRRPAGQAVEEQRPERVDVGAAVERMSLRLLGRDVVARPEHPPGLRQRGCVVDARDAEVGQLGVAIGGQEHVVGLHVAMDDAALVGVGERRGHLHGDRERLGDRQAALQGDPLVQVASVDELADDERPPVGLAAVDDRDDPGVREQRERARLALEAVDRVGRLEPPGVQQLDRDGRPSSSS